MYDFHTHFIPEEVMDWIQQHQHLINAEWTETVPGETWLTVNGKWGFELKETFIDFKAYSSEQEKAGITHPVLSPIPQLFLYELPVDVTKELAEVYNESLIKLSKEKNRRLSALATVSLSDPGLAAKQLQIAMNQGLKGAIIGTGAEEKMLDDSFFAPFFEEANHLGAILFIHPLLCEDPRLKKRKMPNLIGVPWETTICAANLLLSGFLDKYPNIKILLAHGGGFLPYQIGRLNKGYGMWKDLSDSLKAEPIDYLRHFWFDNVLWHPEAVQYLVETVGEDRVVPGTDFPFDLCTYPPANAGNAGAIELLK